MDDNLLVKERLKRGLSLREASAIIGISHSYLSSLERGSDPRTGSALLPSQNVLFKISKAYEIEFSALIAYFSLYGDIDIYTYMGHQLRALRKSNPKMFKKVLELIYKE